MEKNTKFWKLSAAMLAGECSVAQENELNNILSGNNQLKNEFDEMKKEWNKFGPSTDGNFNSPDKAWNSLRNRLEEDGLIDDNIIKRHELSWYFFRIAAVFLLIAGIGISIVYLTGDKDGLISHGHKYYAASGIMTVNLPDGSNVHLNKDAEIVLSSSFPVTRNISLKGEAYFEVEAMENNPFTISAGDAEITVIGTSFNVRQTDSEKVEVLVETGRVKLNNFRNPEGVFLEPGQMAVASEEQIQYIELKDQNYLSWKTHEFRFINTKLDEILDVLENAYHIEISKEAGVPENLRLTTSYSNQPADSIIETICKAFNLKYSKDGDNYLLKKP